MTRDTIAETAALKALLSETADHQILAEMPGFVADRLMALDVDQLCGASSHERSAGRMNHRNGYRERPSHRCKQRLPGKGKGRAAGSRTRTVESAAIRVEAHRDSPEWLGLVLPGADEPIAPTHWSFGQLACLVGAPAPRGVS